MSNLKIEDLVNLLNEIPSLTKKTSQKVALDLLKKQKANPTFFNNINEVIENLHFCLKCNKITDNEDFICNTCKENTSKTLILIKNYLEFFNLESIVEINQYNSYILNLDSKNDVINFLSFKDSFDRLKNFITSNPNIKDIIFSFSHTSENEILIKLIQEQFKDKYDFYHLAKGLPSGNSLEYIDQDTLKFAFQKKEKI